MLIHRRHEYANRKMKEQEIMRILYKNKIIETARAKEKCTFYTDLEDKRRAFTRVNIVWLLLLNRLKLLDPTWRCSVMITNSIIKTYSLFSEKIQIKYKNCERKYPPQRQWMKVHAPETKQPPPLFLPHRCPARKHFIKVQKGSAKRFPNGKTTPNRPGINFECCIDNQTRRTNR